MECWKEYIEDLHDKDQTVNSEFDSLTDEKEPPILESEVKRALSDIAQFRSPGSDNISIELLKIADQAMVKTLTLLCNRIW